MKPVKQKGQDYVDAEIRLEAALDGLLYHPWNRRRVQRRYKNGFYLNLFKGIRGIMKKRHGSIRDLNLYFTGVSHLDAAWLFPVVDTKERAYKTFYKAIEHCELYPFLTFSQTTPQYFNWIKKYDSKLWEKVKKFVKDGRIELTGGMWLEPDLDMSCGEALVRQRLYGQLFFQREFEFMPKMESVLDVFGFPWSIPQILVKSGAESFWTTKCMGNDTAGWPFNAYMWQGIDGSQIFTYQFTYNWDSLDNHNRFRKMARFPAPEFNQRLIDSHMMKSEVEDMFSKKPGDFNKEFPVFYGLGDGGRGPVELEIIFADTLARLHNGKHISQHEYIEILKKSVGDRYFIWNDEMYLEYHRGTKTTQLEVKHFNRRAECWVQAAENLLTITNLLNPDLVDYSKPEVFEMWRKVLFNQFHDILPGSSIPDVYILAIKEQKDSINTAKSIINRCLSKIPIQEDEILVYNPYNWDRNEYALIDGNWMYFEDVKPLSVKKASKSKVVVDIKKTNNIDENDNCFIIENEFIRASILKKSGTLVSLIDKSLNKEVIITGGTRGNLGSGLRVFTEVPKKWKAWNIGKTYPKQKIPYEIKEKTAIKTGKGGIKQVSTNYQFLKSTCEVSFFLLPNDKMLRLSIQTDVKDKELFVKYFIPLNLKSEDVTAEIPYGSIQRKRLKRTEREKAKWEMGTQKWIDVSDETHGITITNNNSYGFSATPKGIYLTLTRTPIYPGVSPLYGSTRLIPKKERPKYTDMMPFDYEFALIPHEGTWKDVSSWKEGYNFNQELITYSLTGSEEHISKSENESVTELDLNNTFISTDSKNVFISAIKASEWTGTDLSELKENDQWTWDKKTFIIRVVESEGVTTICKISLNKNLSIHSISETDLLERDQKEVQLLNSNAFEIEIKPFEICTYKLILN